MKHAGVILLCFLSVISFGQSAQRYIFFLHNKFIEESGVEGVHPEYGRAEYKEIVAAFEKEGFTVISEVRPKGCDARQYSKKVVQQADSLIKKGVNPSRITIIGTSKGGYIAMYASAILKNPRLNFVLIGCCSSTIKTNDPEFDLCGNILSIYEKSDDIGRSCSDLRWHSSNKTGDYKEIELNTGLKHGFLYKPLKEWMKPCIEWAKKH